MLCTWRTCQSCTFVRLQTLGTKETLHPVPTFQNNEPVPQVQKQFVSLSCYLGFWSVSVRSLTEESFLFLSALNSLGRISAPPDWVLEKDIFSPKGRKFN